MGILRLLLALGVITGLGAAGADLALAHRMADTSNVSVWSLLFVPLKETMRYGLAPVRTPQNFLIVGTDAVYDTSGRSLSGVGGHSDALMFVRIEPAAERIDILSIPRDTLVSVPGRGPTKIGVVNYLGGTPLLKRTVENLLHMPIQHTIRLDMPGLCRLIDAIGGVDVNIEQPLNYDDQTAHLHIHFAPGHQHLNGQKAMEYLRFRHDALGDIGRVRRQQAFLRALLAQTLKRLTPWQLPGVVQAVQQNTHLDVTPRQLWNLGTWYCLNPHKTVHMAVVPGKFDYYGRSSVWRADRPALARLLSHTLAVAPVHQAVPWLQRG